jgi:hypothetical protein
MAPTVAAASGVSVTLRVVGMPTSDQLHDLTKTVAAQHDGGVALSLDLRELDPALVSSDAVREIAAFLGELGSRGGGLRRIAVLAPAGKASYGIARMLQLHVDSAGVETGCFQDAFVAEQWLLFESTAKHRQESRTFTSPSGRQWTAEAYELPPSMGVRTRDATIPAKAVLRFISCDLTLDLHGFPADWARRTDDELTDLLRQSSPPAFAPLKDETVKEWGAKSGA